MNRCRDVVGQPPPERVSASVARRKRQLGRRRVRPSVFGWHGDGADSLPLQAQAFEKPANLRRLTADAGEFFDSLTGFGNGPSRLLIE